MSATDTLQPDQFYAHVPREQLREMNNRRAASFNAIGEARRSGNVGATRNALSMAAWHRRTEQQWRPILQR